MKIKSLKIRGFRGIDEKVEILFASGLNLIYAPNGWGKSSRILGATTTQMKSEEVTDTCPPFQP